MGPLGLTCTCTFTFYTLFLGSSSMKMSQESFIYINEATLIYLIYVTFLRLIEEREHHKSQDKTLGMWRISGTWSYIRDRAKAWFSGTDRSNQAVIWYTTSLCYSVSGFLMITWLLLKTWLSAGIWWGRNWAIIIKFEWLIHQRNF